MQQYQKAKWKLFPISNENANSLKQKQNNLICRRAGAGWLSKRGREWRCVSASTSNVGSQCGDDHPTHTARHVLFYILTVEQVSFFIFFYPKQLLKNFVLSFKTLDEREIFILTFYWHFLSHRKVFCFFCWLKRKSITLSCTLSRLLTFSFCFYLPFKRWEIEWQEISCWKFHEGKFLGHFSQRFLLTLILSLSPLSLAITLSTFPTIVIRHACFLHLSSVFSFSPAHSQNPSYHQKKLMNQQEC